MANYYGTARTNYFAVKDAEAFKNEIGQYPVNVIEEAHSVEGTLYGFLDNNADGAGMPYDKYDEDTDNYIEIDWEDLFRRHLKDGWVAVMMEAGAEKYRYITGYAVAYNNKGESRKINLDDIYKVALEIGTEITRAEY